MYHTIQYVCMAQASATVTMDEKGRVVIPKAAREKLGIDGERTQVDLEVRYDG